MLCAQTLTFVRDRMLQLGVRDFDPAGRFALDRWLEEHPELQQLYAAKEALHSLYCIRGTDGASRAFTALTDHLARPRCPNCRPAAAP